MPNNSTFYFSDRAALVPSTTATTSGNGASNSTFGPAKTVRAQLSVTAASGTAPMLDVVIEDTLDGVNFYTVATFTQATVVSRQVLNVSAPFTDTLRARWTLTGTTPSFTFAVDTYSEG